MAHFAQIDSDQMVTSVVVVNNNDLIDENSVELEELGISFLKSIYGDDTQWKQTSYNSNFRGHFAGIDSHYCSANDTFSEPRPYESWVLDETNNWQPPIPKPDDIINDEPPHIIYVWNEELYQQNADDGWQSVEVDLIIPQ